VWRSLQPYPRSYYEPYIPTGVEPSESCVYKEVFIRHLPLSLPFRTQSGHHIRIRNIEKCRRNIKNVGKSLLLTDSLKGMKEHTGETYFV
jgi:hypothetical protein